MEKTDELPREPGFYWVFGEDDTKTVVEVDGTLGELQVLDVDIWRPLGDFADDWELWSDEPIEEPI